MNAFLPEMKLLTMIEEALKNHREVMGIAIKGDYDGAELIVLLRGGSELTISTAHIKVEETEPEPTFNFHKCFSCKAVPNKSHILDLSIDDSPYFAVHCPCQAKGSVGRTRQNAVLNWNIWNTFLENEHKNRI